VTPDGNPSPLSPLLTSANLLRGWTTLWTGRTSLGRALPLRFVGISMAMYELPLPVLAAIVLGHPQIERYGLIFFSRGAMIPRRTPEQRQELMSLYAVTLDSDSFR
jgi:hypothetical protein